LGAQLTKLRKRVIDVTGADVKGRADHKAAARAGRNAPKLGHRGDLGRQSNDDPPGQKRAPGVQGPGRREGLRLGENVLVGEQLAAVGAEDQLDTVGVLGAR
jgi:hypothetical protein